MLGTSSSTNCKNCDLVLINNSDDVAVTQVYDETLVKLHIHFCNQHDDSINSIILQAVPVFHFDKIDYIPILNNKTLSAQDKFLELKALVESRNILYPNYSAKFLKLLLNLEGQEFISNIVKNIVSQEKFRERVEVIEVLNPTEEHSINEEPLVHTEVTEESSEKEQFITTNPEIDTKENSRINIVYKISMLYFGFLVTMSIFTISLLAFLSLLLIAYSSSNGSGDNSSPINFSTTTATRVTNVTTTPFVIFSDDTLNITESTTIFIPPTTPQLATRTFPKPGNISTLPNISFGSLPKYKVKAKSYQEYASLMSNIPPNHEVDVSIHSQNPFDWPTIGYTQLPNSTEINKLFLRGLLAADNIIDILSQCPNIEHLHFINNDDALCQRNQGQLNLVKQISKQVYLPSLRYLVLREFSRCTEIFETFALYITPLRNLRRFTLYRGLLDDHNHIFLQEFLKVQAKHIKELVIAEMTTKITKPFLEASPNPFLMQNVERIRLDSNSSMGSDTEIKIGRNFPKIYPNLRVFYSNSGYIKWNKVSNLVRCKKINELTVGIEVPLNRTYFNASFLHEHFPFLTKAVISLKFLTCSTPASNELGKNEIIGWGNVRKPLVFVVIRSNCKIYANTVKTLRTDTEEKYDGSYMFTYKILSSSD